MNSVIPIINLTGTISEISITFYIHQNRKGRSTHYPYLGNQNNYNIQAAAFIPANYFVASERRHKGPCGLRFRTILEVYNFTTPAGVAVSPNRRVCIYLGY